MQKSSHKKGFYFLDNFIRMCYVKLSLLRREYLSSAVKKHVLRNSSNILHITKGDSSVSITFKVIIDMLKVLAYIFQQCLGSFTISPVEGSSERD